ncbi:MAG: CocE/NonD family hydrolase [Candidatus Tectomicrobia bacterium]|uniref:CocE/NonD family hydrolase n=1 Tax=Tectimicrobiota bacterium TaxID=2528274 RepID=A0A932MNT0_UNCTE|nr:CocE/NonD family hydrolase [Candidatus Tectomicrobia bacterium]
MRVDWDVPIEMDDGVVLRADVFRPVQGGTYPPILSYGPYAKWLHTEDGYPQQWKTMVERFPDTAAGSTNKYQTWEVVDPEKWVPDGYAVVRVDARGVGRSEGFLDPWSAREARDLHDCIEWAARQPWSNGRVGLNGISYFAMNQWQAASLQPPHLAAMCAWEGAADFYRDMGHHGGIHCRFPELWYVRRVVPRQHGKGERGYRSRMNGEWVSGPETLPEEALAARRADFAGDVLKHDLDDDYWKSRMPDWSKVKVPFLSPANWGGVGLHPRGNFEAFTQAASKEKWLEVHGFEHWTGFFTDAGVAYQKKFFGHFLKGEDTGWKKEPPVRLLVRHPGDVFVERAEREWPLARTKWTKLYLHPADQALSAGKPARAGKASYPGLGEGLTFLTAPFKTETEITGPAAAKLFISSETGDADLFLALRLFDPAMKEVVFEGAMDHHTPVALGWLRASHRKLDKKLSLPWRPYHAHDEKQPLAPGRVYELDVEIWPTSVVVPPGHRLGLSVRGRDYVWQGSGKPQGENTGCGPFIHDHPRARPADIFGGRVTIHAGPDRPSHVLLPVIPAKKG